MAMTHVDQLWASVQAQPKRLTTKERRRVLTYLAELGELDKYSNYELAAYFSVSEKQIREDKKHMLLSIGENLTADHASSLVAQYKVDLDSLIAQARKGLHAATPGGPYHKAYCDALGKLLQQKFQSMQEIGIVPKELGHMAVTSEVWEATISDDQVTTVTRVKDDDEAA